jgi:hypothetical protein
MFCNELILLCPCVNRQDCSLIPRPKAELPKHRFVNNTTDAAVTGWRRCHPCAEAVFGRRQERSMPIDFLEVHNGVPVSDLTGLHFKSDLAAIRHNRSVANRFRSDGRLTRHALFVIIVPCPRPRSYEVMISTFEFGELNLSNSSAQCACPQCLITHCTCGGKHVLYFPALATDIFLRANERLKATEVVKRASPLLPTFKNSFR